jgi:hypothetical protein
MPRKPTKLAKSAYTQDDIDILNVDIAGSFFMDMIGQNMPIFVELLKKIVVPGSHELATELANLHVENVTLEQKFDNAMVPRARPKLGEDLAEVHWLFIVKNPGSKHKLPKALKSTDYTVYNAYEKNMQKKGSHQFCQSHALYMAYKYYSGLPIPATNPRDAYVDLLKFWKILLDNIASTGLNKPAFIKKTLESTFELNRQTESNTVLVEHVIAKFPKKLADIYAIMTTDFAKVYCPTWM